MLHEVRQENALLREILASRGIPFESELDNRRRAAGMMRLQRDTSTLSPTSQNTARNGMYQTSNRGPPSSNGYSPMQNQRYVNGAVPASRHSPGTTHHSNSPSGPDIQEQVPIKQEHSGVPDMPGIFENDPQLGVDFILA